MTALLVVGVGLLGGVGAVARFLLDGAVASRAASAFPWGTLAVNLTGALAERALTLPRDGEIEAEALVGWLAGLGALAGVGLAAGALVLLAATTSAGTTVAGLAAGAVLAVVPAVLARRRRPADPGVR